MVENNRNFITYMTITYKSRVEISNNFPYDHFEGYLGAGKWRMKSFPTEPIAKVVDDKGHNKLWENDIEIMKQIWLYLNLEST